MRSRSNVSAATFVLALILAAMVGLFALLFVGLPSQLKADIRTERQRLETSKKNLVQQRETVAKALNRDPELFRPPGFNAEWEQTYKRSEAMLGEADRATAKLDKLARANKRRSVSEVDRVLREERELRLDAESAVAPIYSALGKREAFKRNFPEAVQQMEANASELASADYALLKAKVEKAENDWPGKRDDLGARLDKLVSTQKNAAEWAQSARTLKAKSSEALTGEDYAQALRMQDQLAGAPGQLVSQQLTQETGQLYTEWDKLLEDLDHQMDGYRSKVKQVITTVPAPNELGASTSNESWQTLSEPQWRALERNVGMTLAHKDFGKYDSEADQTAQPPGFAYMASPEQGRNQYGYWDQRGGESVWTWLPQYLILRDLLSNRYYQPIPRADWSRYQQAQRAGTTYYGQDTSGRPKYGSSGTFTQRSYASSRYVQSGGFAGSRYTSGVGRYSGSPVGASPSSSGYSGSRFGSSKPSVAPPSSGYFGSRYGSATPSGGQRFGRSGQPSGGARFGGGSRSAGRGFGRRR